MPALFLLPVSFTPASVGLLAVSCVAEGLYLLTLSACYVRLDYTLVYAVARGSAPVFIAVGAAVLLGERVSRTGLAGILLVSLGIVSMQGPRLLRTQVKGLGLPAALRRLDRVVFGGRTRPPCGISRPWRWVA